MRLTKTTKLPKTFLISIKLKSGRCGYLRYRSVVDDMGKIRYDVHFTTRMVEASRFLNVENTKLRAKNLLTELNLPGVEVIDESNGRRHVIH